MSSNEIKPIKILILDDADADVIAEFLECNFDCSCEITLRPWETYAALNQAETDGSPFTIAVVDDNLLVAKGSSLMGRVRRDPILKHHIPEGTTDQNLVDFYLNTGRLNETNNRRLSSLVETFRMNDTQVVSGIMVAAKLLEQYKSLRVILSTVFIDETGGSPRSQKLTALKSRFPGRFAICCLIEQFPKHIMRWTEE